jgi:hypothetical protein
MTCCNTAKVSFSERNAVSSAEAMRYEGPWSDRDEQGASSSDDATTPGIGDDTSQQSLEFCAAIPLVWVDCVLIPDSSVMLPATQPAVLDLTPSS